jgi:hypothetical protein
MTVYSNGYISPATAVLMTNLFYLDHNNKIQIPQYEIQSD